MNNNNKGSVLTKKLNNGKTVLAMAICDGEHLAAIGYTNMTAASTRAVRLQEHGVECKVIGSRPYYIQILKGDKDVDSGKT